MSIWYGDNVADDSELRLVGDILGKRVLELGIASTSNAVRYSRVRSTVEFTMVGAVSPPACESMKNAPPKYRTVEQLLISSTVATDKIRVSQTVTAPLCPDVSLGRKPTLAATTVWSRRARS